VSSSSSVATCGIIGCGCAGRLMNGDGGACVTAGARLVARIEMLSKFEVPCEPAMRGATTYPAAERSTVSSALASGTSRSSSVTGGPKSLSPLTILV
jgi:hypothetical protein